MSRILVVKLGAIGDVIMALPTLQAIWSSDPDCQVDWVIGQVAAPVLKCVKDSRLRILQIDERLLFRGNFLRRLRVISGLWRRIGLMRYDRILIMNSDLRYGVLTLASFGPRRWFKRGGKSRGVVPGRHHSIEYVRMFNNVDDASIEMAHYPNMYFPDLPRELSDSLKTLGRPLVAVSPAGSKNVMREDGLRRWPVDNYQTMINELKKRGCKIILVGGPGDEWASKLLEKDCDMDMIGRLDLSSFLNLLSKMDLVVTHDSGPLHMADIAGTPAIGIFGPTPACSFRPISAPYKILKCSTLMECQPCYDGKNYASCKNPKCMLHVFPKDVVIAAMDLLAEQGIVL